MGVYSGKADRHGDVVFLMRLVQALLGAAGTLAALAGHAQIAPQILETAGSCARCLENLAISDGPTNTDVHRTIGGFLLLNQDALTNDNYYRFNSLSCQEQFPTDMQ